MYCIAIIPSYLPQVAEGAAPSAAPSGVKEAKDDEALIDLLKKTLDKLGK